MNETISMRIKRISAHSAEATVGVGESGRLLFEQEPLPALPGGTLVNGRYTIDRVIGAGGMGVVYRATDALRDGEAIALKTIRGQFIQADELSLFKAEFKVAAGLRHPNIAAVYDFEAMPFSDDHFFTMELVSGSDVLSATASAPLPRIVDLLVDMCRALAYIHDHGVIHFDLKPANVFFDMESRAKVLDFGLAGARARAESHGLIGTPAYIAPELIRGSEVDHRADLYSLGITAFQLLCRRIPFQGPDMLSMYHQHCSEPLSFGERDRSRVPEWLRAIVMRLCEKEASSRYRTAGAVIDAINRGGGLTYEHVTRETKESYVLSSRFIGRRDELDGLIAAALSRTKGERTHKPALFVRGQSGIGKSRLMRELRHVLQLGGLSFVEGSSYEVEANEFGAFSDILRHLVALAEAVGGEKLVREFVPELLKVAPSLAREYAVAPSVPLADARDEQLRLFESVSEFVLRLCAATPIVLYLNDLQWSKPGAVALLLHLTRRVHAAEEDGKTVRLTVFGSYRHDELERRPIAAVLSELDSLGASETIGLTPLSPEQVSDLARSMLGIDELPARFTARLWEETAGNPFFIQEVMRVLVENGSVYLEGGAWAALDDVDQLDIPAGVAAVFLRRVSALDPPARSVLEALAAFAAPTSAQLLAHASGLPRESVHDALVLLERRQMTVVEEQQYRISHDRIRETVYGALEPSRCRALHARIAESLADASEDERSARAELLAHHYARAGELDEAVRCGRSAAERANDQRQVARALDLYEQVAQWLASMPETPERCEPAFSGLVEINRLAEFLGHRERQQAAINRLLELAEKSGSIEHRVRALGCQAGASTHARRFAEARSALETALALCGSIGEPTLERDLLRSAAFCAWQASDDETAARYNEQALALDELLDDRRGRATDLTHLASCIRVRDPDRAIALVEEAMAIEHELGDRRMLGQTKTVLGAIFAAQGDHRAKLREWESSAEYWEDFPSQKVIFLASQGSTRWQLGDIDGSLQAYEEAAACARTNHFVSELARALRMLGEIHASVGHRAPAAVHFAECASMYARMGEQEGEADAWERAAELFGAGPRAAFAWRKLRALAKRTRRHEREIDALAGLARACGPDGAAEAEHHLEEALALAETECSSKRAGLLNSLAIIAWQDKRFELALARYRRAFECVAPTDLVHRAFLSNSIGATLRSLGRDEEACAHFERALREAEDAGERLVAGHALAALGDVHVSAGDDERAIDRYRCSLRIRVEIGDARGEAWMSYKLAVVLMRLSPEGTGVLARARELAQTCSDSELLARCDELERRHELMQSRVRRKT